MKLLPTRHVSLPYPIALMQSARGDLVPSAESVALWLRAWPGLLGCGPSINWLWPRDVDRRRKSRSRLWGRDSIASLFVVEIRIDRGDAPDPFEGFVRDLKCPSVGYDWTDLRYAVGNLPPVLVGVVATTQSHFRLSLNASKSVAFLQKHVGREGVLLRSISAKQVEEGLRIRCHTPGSKDRGKSVITPIY
jgi:hypothetical protein